MAEEWEVEVLRWLVQPAVPWAPTATWSEVLWLALSLVGLALTARNLADAWQRDRWRRRHESADWALAEVARAHVEQGIGFVAVDAACVLIGFAAVFNWRNLPVLIVVGLLLVRLLLPAIALRDLRLRQRMFRLGRARKEGVKP